MGAPFLMAFSWLMKTGGLLVFTRADHKALPPGGGSICWGIVGKAMMMKRIAGQDYYCDHSPPL